MVNPFGRGKRQLGDNTTKQLAQSVKVARPPTSDDTHDPRTGKPFIKGTFWIVDQNPSSGSEGDLYYLKYNDVSSATWAAVLTGSGASSIDSLTTDSGTAIPDGTGDVDILGGTNIATSASGDAVTVGITGTIDESNGGTGQSTYSEFDLLIGNSSGGLDRSSQIDTAAQLPDGTDGERPGTPSNGLVRYSSTNNCVEAYVNGSWVCLYDTGDTIPVDSGGTGATSLDGVLIGNGTSPITGLGTLTTGDLLVGDGDSTPTIFSVGTDGQVLSANSAQPGGLEWIDCPCGGGMLEGDLNTVALTQARNVSSLACLLGVRLNSSFLADSVQILNWYATCCTQADDGISFVILKNPSITGTPTWNTVSKVDYTVSVLTLTGGTELARCSAGKNQTTRVDFADDFAFLLTEQSSTADEFFVAAVANGNQEQAVTNLNLIELA